MVIFFLSISEIFPQFRPLSCKNVIDGIPEFVHLYLSICSLLFSLSKRAHNSKDIIEQIGDTGLGLGTSISNLIQGLFRKKDKFSIYKTDVTTRIKQEYSSQSKHLL